MNDILKLIKEESTRDEYGDPVTEKKCREVFCRMASIGQKEFYEAQALGFQPEIKFILADYYDYDKESLVEYEGSFYRVLRTFRNGQELEITCTREVNQQYGHSEIGC